jgi:hypothetical protein
MTNPSGTRHEHDHPHEHAHAHAHDHDHDHDPLGRSHAGQTSGPTGADPMRVVRDALGLPDAAARARALTSLLVDAREWVAFLSAQRDDALRAMRADGASYSDVATLLGVNKSRAQQICSRVERDAGGPRHTH